MDKNDRRLILLFSLILVVIPMVLFPERLGLPLVNGSAVNMLYEVVFYGFVYFMFRRRTTLPALMVGSALTLVYRMTIGALFGLAMMVMYDLESPVAFSLGMTKYLPGVFLHVLAAPFVFRPVYMHLADQMISSRRVKARPVSPAPGEKREDKFPVSPALTFSQERTGSNSVIAERMESFGMAAQGAGQVPGYSAEENQFDRAVNYIGESSVVQMALLVDEEGLLLANFNRSSEDIELWAPLSIVLRRNSRQALYRFGKEEQPDRIDLGTHNFRIILRRIERVTLMILADRDADETIQIRIAQATDMIRKYMNERYSPAMFARVEEHYVSDS